MKHSGLQKSISSIFDGAEPVKQETAAAAGTATTPNPVAAAPARPQPAAPTGLPPVRVGTSSLAVAISQGPSAGQVAAAVPAAVPQPAKQASRPRPVPRKNKNAQNTISIKDLWTTIKSKLAGNSKGSLDPRQKKALILGILLAAVFAVVLMFVLSGPSGAKAASKKAAKEGSSATLAGGTENWQKPEIYPLSLRDPMKPSSGAKSTALTEDEMTVRGIVYSSVNPSAIIANQIVYEGDVILGVKITKIGKDFVAFEKDGKQWQQQVRQ